MKTISLNGVWNLLGQPQESNSGEKISLTANVPGCVQLDLSREGYLPEDLYMGMNITETEKFEDFEWWYERSFSAPEEKENVYLVFEGVDCVAEYYLNGRLFGESENMLIAHEFRVDDYLVDGENILTVHIKAPCVENHYLNYTVSNMLSWDNGALETGLRRAPHTYGWDIMPRAVTSGLWRDVKLEARDKIYFKQLYMRGSGNLCNAFFELECDWADFKDVEIVFKGSCGEDSTFEHTVKLPKYGKASGKAKKTDIVIPNAKKWWPYGYGEPNVYDATASIYSEGVLVHEAKTSFGLRTIELDRTEATDGISGQFRFLVNGVEIMCKGSNWVPLDAFHCRDKERYPEALALVKDIGCNILRCWGGNVYEDHEFYDFCDRNGIMIWQDFGMACRLYPEDDRYKRLIEEEATAVVRKLRHHPSIILWSGDNEIDQLLSNFTDPNNNSLTREVLPKVVRLNDIRRPYLASSPYYSKEFYENKSKGLVAPEGHVWGPRDYFKSDFYKNDKSHFISETGYHGCPDMESIKKFITPEKIWPYQDNEEWNLHSSDQQNRDNRTMLMHKQVAQLFGDVPTDPEDYIYASQISQAEAKKYFIERMRSGRPKKTGIIWWNLLDGWPQMSDAVVDYYFNKKIAYRYIKRSQSPFTIVATEIQNWRMAFKACNDTLKDLKGHCVIKDAETEEIIFDGDFYAPKNQSTQFFSTIMYYSAHKMLIIEWEIDGEKGMNHYLCGYPPFDLKKYKELADKYGI
ncbi:MAG: hypothetical protein IJZ75_05930 [Clostridia bacterium]|nr:hypothetical protein [Clostridia bacterium]